MVFCEESILVFLTTAALPLLGMLQDGTPDQGGRPAGTHQDLTDAKTWIARLERPNRIAGLKTSEVISCLKLKPGDVVADIGAGVGAFSIPLAKAVAPSGKVLAVDIWKELLEHLGRKAANESVGNIQTVLAQPMDPSLPDDQLDLAFFHDVFHNTNDRQSYLKKLVSCLKPTGRIAIIEQEFDDPIARKWDPPEDRITKEEVDSWMANVGFQLLGEFDIFAGKNNPEGAVMPARWFVVYGRPSPSKGDVG